MVGLLKDAFRGWRKNDCPRIAAALAYYTVFSLPPLLLIVLTVTGVVVDPEQISGRIRSEMASLLGSEAARQIQEMIRNIDRPETGGSLTVVLSVGALLFGATGAFVQLQDALNRVWEVDPDRTDRGKLTTIVMKRVLSFGMVLTIAFLLLVSMVLSAAVSTAGETLAAWLPTGLSSALLQLLEFLVSLGMAALLFALIFRVLPDVRIAWSDVWVGAVATALLFVVGEALLGFYFSKADPGAAFGAAGSLALILVWVYYSSLIVLYGAEFTQAWAMRRSSGS